MEFTWITVVMVGVAGFFGSGAYVLWRDKSRFASGIVGAIAVVCIVIAVLSVIPGPSGA